MKFPTPKKVLDEDLKGAPSWASVITGSINSTGEALAQIFNRNISDVNIACQVYELNYKTTAAYPTMEPVYFLSTLKTKATGVQVLQAVEKTTFEPVAGPVYVPWIEINGQIKVYSITGLQPSTSYIIRLRVT